MKEQDLSGLEVGVEVIEVLRFYQVEDSDEESHLCGFL